MSSRNITLSLPDELIRKAKVLAAERETSISAMVATSLRQLVGEADDYDAVWDEEARAMESGLLEVGRIDWSRDDLHRR
jgi:predicted transcriptional regulator